MLVSFQPAYRKGTKLHLQYNATCNDGVSSDSFGL